MEGRLLAENVKEIEMPENMQARIVENCLKLEDKNMNKSTKNMLKKPMVAVATLALCLCVTGVTALAANGKLQGFFADVIDWNGAVIGTTYEQATDEVEVHAAMTGNELLVTITMLKPDVAPYSALEVMGLEAYEIVDASGKVVMKGDSTIPVNVDGSKVNIKLTLEDIFAGKYKLIVSQLVGGAKADQPLVMNGTWECEFER